MACLNSFSASSCLPIRAMNVARATVGEAGFVAGLGVRVVLVLKPLVEGEGLFEEFLADRLQLGDVGQFLVGHLREHLVHRVHRPLEVLLGSPLLPFGSLPLLFGNIPRLHRDATTARWRRRNRSPVPGRPGWPL